MFLRIRRSNLSVSIRRATSKMFRLSVLPIMLVSILIGVQPVQAGIAKGDASLSDFTAQQQTASCPAVDDLIITDGEECSLEPGKLSFCTQA
jgi:hypothetical protein